MRTKLLIFGLLIGMASSLAQRNTKYGQYAYKILPLSASYYSLDGMDGVRIGIENSIINRPKEWVEGRRTKKSLWQVVSIFNFSTLRVESGNETPNGYMFGASLQGGYRKIFSNALKIEGLTGYQYLRSEKISTFDGDVDAHIWDLAIGVGQDFKMAKESFVTWFIRPGLNFEIASSGLSFFGSSLQIGLDYRFENVHIRPWKNPWFKPKDKALKGKEFQRPNMSIDESREDRKSRKRRKSLERKKRRKQRKQKVNLGKAKYKTGKW